jgi:hypothetical protein
LDTELRSSRLLRNGLISYRRFGTTYRPILLYEQTLRLILTYIMFQILLNDESVKWWLQKTPWMLFMNVFSFILINHIPRDYIFIPELYVNISLQIHIIITLCVGFRIFIYRILSTFEYF